MTLLCYSQENLPSPPITPLSILYKIYTRDQNIEVDKKISILSTFLTFLRLKWSENFGKICIFSLPKSQKLIKNERKSLIWNSKVVRDNILNFCAFFSFGVGVKRVGKIRKINFVLTRKYSKVLEKTRIYSNELEMCTNMWFLVSDCVFYWFFAKVERVWSESEVKMERIYVILIYSN